MDGRMFSQNAIFVAFFCSQQPHNTPILARFRAMPYVPLNTGVQKTFSPLIYCNTSTFLYKNKIENSQKKIYTEYQEARQYSSNNVVHHYGIVHITKCILNLVDLICKDIIFYTCGFMCLENFLSFVSVSPRLTFSQFSSTLSRACVAHELGISWGKKHFMSGRLMVILHGANIRRN